LLDIHSNSHELSHFAVQVITPILPSYSIPCALPTKDFISKAFLSLYLLLQKCAPSDKLLENSCATTHNTHVCRYSILLPREKFSW